MSGTATFGGTLNITLLNGYAPAVDSYFSLMTFASSSSPGDFATKNFSDPGSSDVLQSGFTATALVVGVVPSDGGAITETVSASNPTIDLSWSDSPVVIVIGATGPNSTTPISVTGGQDQNTIIETLADVAPTTITTGGAGSTNDIIIDPANATKVIAQAGAATTLDLSNAVYSVQGKDGSVTSYFGPTVDFTQTAGQKHGFYPTDVTNPSFYSLLDPSQLTSLSNASLALVGVIQTVVAGSGATLYAAAANTAGVAQPGTNVVLMGTDNTVYAPLGSSVQSYSGGNQVIQQTDASQVNAVPDDAAAQARVTSAAVIKSRRLTSRRTPRWGPSSSRRIPRPRAISSGRTSCSPPNSSPKMRRRDRVPRAERQADAEYITQNPKTQAEFINQNAKVFAEYITQDAATQAEFVNQNAKVFAEYITQDAATQAEFINQNAKVFADYITQDATTQAEFVTQNAKVIAQYIVDNTASLNTLLSGNAQANQAYQDGGTAALLSYIGGNPKVLPAFLGANPKVLPAFLGANPNIIPQFLGANPNVIPQFIDANPQTLPAFLGANPNVIPQFLGANPNIIPQFLGANPQVIPAFVAASTANTDLLLQFINANPHIIPQYIGATEAQTPAELVTYLTNPDNLQVLVNFLSDNPALLQQLLTSNSGLEAQFQTFLADNPALLQQFFDIAALDQLRVNVDLAGSGNQASGGLLSSYSLGNGLFTETITSEEVKAVAAAEAAPDGAPIADYELNVSLGAGNNVVVGGLLGNFTAAAGSTNQFVIEDPTLLGIPVGTDLSKLSDYGGTFTGGGGNDTFYFVADPGDEPFGAVTLAEPAGSTGADALDFSNYQAGGVNLNLNLTAGQAQRSPPA